MAYKSLLLSALLTALVAYSLTTGITQPESWLKKMPSWSAIPLLTMCFFLYLLSLWWAIRGFSEHRGASLLSLALCAFGLGLYAFGWYGSWAKGRAAPGQYDETFQAVSPSEMAALEQIASQCSLKPADAVFTQHWRLDGNSKGSFKVCVQKGHITALNFSENALSDLSPFSHLPKLEVLYLNRCGLTDVAALQMQQLDRLEIAGNRLNSLQSLSGCPNLRWLNASGNQLRDTAGLEVLTKLISKNFSDNPLKPQ